MSSTPNQRVPRQPDVIAALLLIAGFAYGLAAVIVIPALSSIADAYGVSSATASWALTINLLGGTVTTPLLARLADRHGHRMVLTAVLAALGVGSVVCLLAPDFGTFLAGRLLQSLASAAFPIGFAVLRSTQPTSTVGRWIGLLSAMTGLGGIGLPLAGPLIGLGGIAALFWLPLALSLVAMPLRRSLPERLPTGTRPSIDWVGAAALALALAAVLLGLDSGPDLGWSSAPVLALLIGGAAATAAWVLIERRVPTPLVSMTVFVRRPVLMSNLSAFFIGFGMYAAYVVIPELVVAPDGVGFGRSVTIGGLVLLPAMVLLPPGVQLATRLAARTSARTVLLGAIAAITLSFLGLAGFRDTLTAVIIEAALLGLGVGAAYAVLPNVITAAVEPSDVGVATGINQITRAAGGAFGTAAAATLLTALAAPGTDTPTSTGFTAVFIVLAVSTALAAGSASGLNTTPRPDHTRTTPAPGPNTSP